MDQDLLIIEEAKRVIDNPGSMIGAEAGGSLKSKLKYGLKQLGWKYNRRATFKANFPFGNTCLIFESTPELDAEERYRIRMVMGTSSVLDYRIMQWAFVETPARGFELKFIDILTNRIFLIVVLLTTVVLLAVIFMYALGVFQQPVE